MVIEFDVTEMPRLKRALLGSVGVARFCFVVSSVLLPSLVVLN